MFFNQASNHSVFRIGMNHRAVSPMDENIRMSIRLSFLLSFSENPVSGLKLPGAGTLTMSVVSSTITQPDASIIFSNGLLPFAANFTKERSGQR